MSTPNGKVAIITGASAGIGKASAVALLKAGYSVAFAGRRQAELEAAVASAGEDASRGLAVVTDVSNPSSVKALFDNYGHMNLGIYVHVTDGGRLTVGDACTEPLTETA